MKTRLMMLFVVLVLLVSAVGCQPAPTPAPTAAAAEQKPAAAGPVLTLEGLKETKTFTLEDLKKLTATEGQAGIKSSTGKITPPAAFKGILLSDLLAQVGGIDPTLGVQIEAKDGYAMTFSADQISTGDFIAYDPGTGDETKNAGTLRPLIAYEMDGKPLDSERDGVLRLVIIGEKNNQVTDGHWSIKWVTKIKVKPMSEEWTLHLEGALTEEMDRATFESGSAEKCHQKTWKDDKAQTWMGMPLWLLVGRVDDEIKHEGPAFNDELADAGYTVEVVAKDGYAVTFDSARVKRNDNLIVAYRVNDNPLPEKDFPLRLVGSDVGKKEGVGAIAKIIVHLDTKPVAAAATVAPTALPPATAEPQSAAPLDKGVLSITGLVGKEQTWKVDELKAMDVVKKTVEHPKKGKQDVEGVSLNALLDLAQPKTGATKLVITAVDGFTAEVDLKAVRDCKDCLIAFNDSGGLKTVMPGMESGLWVKDVVKIEVK